jgi:hypothetical protein
MGSAHGQSVKSWRSATVNGQVLQRVACERRELRDNARELKQIAAAIRAEQLRGELRHLYVKQIESGGVSAPPPPAPQPAMSEAPQAWTW